MAVHGTFSDYDEVQCQSCLSEAIMCNWNSRATLTPPDGFVLVPVEPTEAMLAAAEEAHMPFGDMGFAISAAISARPEVKP